LGRSRRQVFDGKDGSNARMHEPVSATTQAVQERQLRLRFQNMQQGFRFAQARRLPSAIA
jgi:hypothetical protein